MEALNAYRSRFQPSEQLDRPYAMLGVNVFAAETDAAARRLFTSLQQQFVNLRRGAPGRLQPPIDDIDAYCSPAEKAGLDRALACSIVGGPDTVRDGLRDFVARTRADELMVTAQIYDHAARLRSFELTAAARDRLARDESNTSSA